MLLGRPTARLLCRLSTHQTRAFAVEANSGLDINEFDPKEEKHTSTLIFLHGLGDDSRSCWPLVNLAPKHTRVVFPNAPMRPVTINNDKEMQAWYDMYTITRPRDCSEDEEGIHESARRLRLLLASEAQRGVPLHRIVLGGTGQGAAVALWTGLHFKSRLAGILSCSGYMPIVNHMDMHKMFLELAEENKKTPVFSCHGANDKRLLPGYAIESFEKLKKHGVEVEVDLDEEANHILSRYQLIQISRWLQKVLS
eukprot:gnl/Hemi2/19663_TR6528_c0_g1_i1.p1 gnl/Hemi2/19663_TR6528_c0_g1~~gnl/Hemi2/19663_TR6528_c0_g1_i1.p1  ORF type:complete len:267 (-),score=31.41 gnl/Hemi2/19663_TR6528_c0_g1_i1:210-968(-)